MSRCICPFVSCFLVYINRDVSLSKILREISDHTLEVQYASYSTATCVNVVYAIMLFVCVKSCLIKCLAMTTVPPLELGKSVCQQANADK